MIGLFLRQLDGALGRERTEALRNPDVLRVDVSRTEWALDEVFKLPGLDEVAAGRFRAWRGRRKIGKDIGDVALITPNH